MVGKDTPLSSKMRLTPESTSTTLDLLYNKYLGGKATLVELVSAPEIHHLRTTEMHFDLKSCNT